MQRRIIFETVVEITEQLMPADVVECLLEATVLVDLPREEMVDRKSKDGWRIGARFGEYILCRQRRGRCRLGRPVESTVGWRVCLLVLLQVIPAGKNDPAKTIDKWAE